MNWGNVWNAFEKNLVPSVGRANSIGAAQPSNFISKPLVSNTVLSNSKKWSDVLNNARIVADQYGIPQQVMLGQMGQETGNGLFPNAQSRYNSNNYFGLGAVNNKTGFAYDNPYQSMQSYAKTISQDPRYANAWSLRHNPEAMMKTIAPIWAADPSYAQKVIGNQYWRNP
jgi:flagellum-specific peptidoglycan hydrolase FlgJ